MSKGRESFGHFVKQGFKKYLSDATVRQGIQIAIKGVFARLDREAVVNERMKRELRGIVANVRAEIIALNKRYRHFEGRSAHQIELNRSRIRLMIDNVRSIEEMIDASPAE